MCLTVRWEVKFVVCQRRVTVRKSMALVVAFNWKKKCCYMIHGRRWQNITSRCVSSETQCCVAWQTITLVSEAPSSSQMSVTFQWQKWHHILQEMYHRQHKYQNIKSWNIKCLWIALKSQTLIKEQSMKYWIQNTLSLLYILCKWFKWDLYSVQHMPE